MRRNSRKIKPLRPALSRRDPPPTPSPERPTPAKQVSVVRRVEVGASAYWLQMPSRCYYNLISILDPWPPNLSKVCCRLEEPLPHSEPRQRLSRGSRCTPCAALGSGWLELWRQSRSWGGPPTPFLRCLEHELLGQWSRFITLSQIANFGHIKPKPSRQSPNLVFRLSRQSATLGGIWWFPSRHLNQTLARRLSEPGGYGTRRERA